MAQPKLSLELAQQALDAYHACGKNGLAAARQLGIGRGAFEGRLLQPELVEVIDEGLVNFRGQVIEV